MVKTAQILYGIVLFSILVKILLIPYAQVVDADAVSRIFLSVDWKNNPHWILTSIWGPFHFYFIGIMLMVWDDPVLAPCLLHILFSAITCIPFYYFVKRTFNESGAIVAVIFFAICPILFRNSFMALSETPYLFFLALTLNLLSRGIKLNQAAAILGSGISLTIAAGLRYEAWVLIFVFTLVLLLFKKWKYAIVFLLAALIFPVTWMLTNMLATGDPLFSIQGNYHWTIDMMGNNDNLDMESYLRRIWFFPLSLMIALGPPVAFLVMKKIFSIYKTGSQNYPLIIWSLPFWILFFIVEYNSFKGVLLLQHRFTGTLFILCLPFIAPFFNTVSKRNIRMAFLFGFLCVALSFIYNTDGVKPLPRLKDQTAAQISAVIKSQHLTKGCMILDFIGWENTYYLALHSNYGRENIVITGGAKNSGLPAEEIHALLKSHDHGLLLLKKDSPLCKILLADGKTVFTGFDPNHYSAAAVYENNSLILFRWIKEN